MVNSEKGGRASTLQLAVTFLGFLVVEVIHVAIMFDSFGSLQIIVPVSVLCFGLGTYLAWRLTAFSKRKERPGGREVHEVGGQRQVSGAEPRALLAHPVQHEGLGRSALAAGGSAQLGESS